MGTTDRLWLALALAAAGCNIFGPNQLHVRGDAPFKLGTPRTALFSELPSSNPDRGDGRGLLLMSTEKLDCGDLEDWVDGRQDKDDWLVWEGRGLLAEFAFHADEDVGFEGEYLHGMFVIGGHDYYYGGGYTEDEYYDYYYEGEEPEQPDVPPTRIVESTVFSDGSLYDLEGVMGNGEIKVMGGGLVKGTLETRLYGARFRAEDCGSFDDTGGDTGYGYGYGYREPYSTYTAVGLW